MASLEEGNEEELEMLYSKVQKMKRLSQQLNSDLDDDAGVLTEVSTKTDASQGQLMSTLDNLSSAFTQDKRANVCKLAGAGVVAMVLFYLVLSVRL